MHAHIPETHTHTGRLRLLGSDTHRNTQVDKDTCMLTYTETQQVGTYMLTQTF